MEENLECNFALYIYIYIYMNLLVQLININQQMQGMNIKTINFN